MGNQDPKTENSGGEKKAAPGKKSSGPKYTGCDLDYFVSAQDVPAAVSKLDQAGFFLEDISCLDLQEGFLLVYHFDRFDRPGRVVLRVVLEREQPQAPSIYEIYPGAAWHERECYDFFGIRFTGHPNLLPLLLDPDRQGPPPLLKDESTRKDLHHLYLVAVAAMQGAVQKEPARKDLHHLYLDRDLTPISPESPEFIQQITNCSNRTGRTQS